MRIVVALCLVTMATAAFPFDSDWRESYVRRPDNDSTLHRFADRHLGSTRKIISLNGNWEVKLRGTERSYLVSVPGSYDYKGEVEYERNLNIDSSMVDYAFRLVAFGISTKCKILLNDEFLTSHSGAHTAFDVLIDNQKIHFNQENRITILVENRLDPRNTLPLKHHPRIPKNPGGIFRDIFVVASPTLFIDKPKVTTYFGDSYETCTVQVKTRALQQRVVTQTDTPYEFFFEVRARGEDRVVGRSQEVVLTPSGFSTTIAVSAELSGYGLWTPDTPDLYTLTAVLKQGKQIIDVFKSPLGFSRFEATPDSFRLNGAGFVIRGVDYVEDFPASGPIATYAALDRDLRAIKEMGANCIRVMVPPHPLLLDICDEIGLLVFQETPLSVVPQIRMRENGFVDLCNQYVTEIWTSSRNHVSFAALGLGADFQRVPELESFLWRILPADDDFATQTYVVSRFLPHEALQGQVDFILYDMYDWNQRELEDFIVERLASVPSPAVAIVGFPFEPGFDPESRLGEDAPARTDTENEEHHAYVLSRMLNNAALQRRMSGVFVHSYSDWELSHPSLTVGIMRKQPHSRSGLVTSAREKRIALEVVTADFKGLIPLKLTTEPLESRSPNTYPVAGLFIVLAFLFHFNRSRRLRSNLKRIFVHPHGFYTELRENRKVSKVHTLLLAFAMCGIVGIVISSTMYNFRQSMVFDEILNLFFPVNNIKRQLIWLLWHPKASVLFFSGLYLAMTAGLVLLLRTVSFMFGGRLPTGQFFTLVYWSSVSIIWLLPIVPIFYRIIHQTSWLVFAFVFVLGISFWSVCRMVRAVKIIFTLTWVKTLFLVSVLLVATVGPTVWYYDKQQGMFDYVKIYWDIGRENI